MLYKVVSLVTLSTYALCSRYSKLILCLIQSAAHTGALESTTLKNNESVINNKPSSNLLLLENMEQIVSVFNAVTSKTKQNISVCNAKD